MYLNSRICQSSNHCLSLLSCRKVLISRRICSGKIIFWFEISTTELFITLLTLSFSSATNFRHLRTELGANLLLFQSKKHSNLCAKNLCGHYSTNSTRLCGKARPKGSEVRDLTPVTVSALFIFAGAHQARRTGNSKSWSSNSCFCFLINKRRKTPEQKEEDGGRLLTRSCILRPSVSCQVLLTGRQAWAKGWGLTWESEPPPPIPSLTPLWIEGKFSLHCIGPRRGRTW